MSDSYENNGALAANPTLPTINTRKTTSVFIGLGAAALTVSPASLRLRLEEVTPILGLRLRGRSAFADVASPEAARRLISTLNGERLGDARLEVQMSRSKEKDRRGNPLPKARGPHRGERGRSLFVGLGPAGGAVGDAVLLERLEEIAPVLGFRRRGQCAFVDLRDAASAERMMRELNHQYLGECRLSVQYSHDGPQAQGRASGRRRRRSPSRGRVAQRERGRRSESRERGRERQRRRRSHSYSSRSRSSSRSSYSSSEDSRDRRRRRERSYSYSSRSRSSSGSYRRRRD